MSYPKYLLTILMTTIFLPIISAVIATQLMSSYIISNDYIFKIGYVYFFNPMKFAVWSFSPNLPFGVKAQSIFIVLMGIISSIILSICTYIKYGREVENNQNTFGSARWMTKSEMKYNQLLEKDGIPIGKISGKYLNYNGDSHILAVAPTRSGKGVGLVIPALLRWKDSVIVHDIKGENYRITKDYRETFSDIVYFNPTSAESAKFNPLLEVRLGTIDEVRDVQNIADILIDPDGSSNRKDYWFNAAHTLLVTTILYVLHNFENPTLSAVADFLSDPKMEIKEILELMSDSDYKPIAHGAKEMKNKAKNELSGVLSTALSVLGLYRDPAIENITSSSSFSISQIMNGEKPMSLYLVVPPSDMKRTRPLVRLILNQINGHLTKDEINNNQKNHKYKLLMMIDEFPTLGNLDFFQTSLSYLAGYGIQCYLIAQSLNQIENIYGRTNSIIDNCHIRIFFATNDDNTAKRISDLLGNKTQEYSQKSTSKKSLDFVSDSNSISEQKTSRPLLTPGEITTLNKDNQLILISGLPPILSNKIRYYLEKLFLEILKIKKQDEPNNDDVKKAA